VPQEADAEKIARLEREIEQLKQEIERLRRALEEALRDAKRQAAPFSRRGPKANPQKPGRKAGACYGRKGHRAVPPTVDQTLEAELPRKCPHCGGGITEDASGAAASQLGPRAVALATQLNKGLGLPYGKTSAVLKQAFGLEVTPGGGGAQGMGRQSNPARGAHPGGPGQPARCLPPATPFRSNRPHRSTLLSRAAQARPDGCRSAAAPPASHSR